MKFDRCAATILRCSSSWRPRETRHLICVNQVNLKLRQDSPVESLGVPPRKRIEDGRNSNNHAMIREIEAASKALFLGLKTNRIRWLHDRKEYGPSKKNGLNQGSIMVSLPLEALQTEVVRNGLIINAMLSIAQMWSSRAQLKQCFTCS